VATTPPDGPRPGGRDGQLGRPGVASLAAQPWSAWPPQPAFASGFQMVSLAAPAVDTLAAPTMASFAASRLVR
jgi:hypothetical protein